MKENTLQELEESSITVLQEFDDIGKEVIQNIADMSNIESDISQNIEKIIKKIDLNDFLQILEKYSQKLGKFQEINKFLESEKTSIKQTTVLSDPTTALKHLQNILSL